MKLHRGDSAIALQLLRDQIQARPPREESLKHHDAFDQDDIMANLIEALDGLAAKEWWKEWQNPAWKQFLLTGDAKHLNLLPKFGEHSWLPPELLEALPEPTQVDGVTKRFFQGCRSAGLSDAFGTWLRRSFPDETKLHLHFPMTCAVATEAGFSRLELALQIAEFVRPLQTQKGTLTSAGEFLLSLDNKLLADLVSKIGRHGTHAPEIAKLFAAHAPQCWRNLLLTFKRTSGVNHLDTSVWLVPLAMSRDTFLEPTARAFDLMESWYCRFDLGRELYKIDSARFRSPMVKLTSERLLNKDTHADRPLWQQANQSACWLIANIGKQALSELKAYFAAPVDKDSWSRKNQSEYKNEALDLAVQKFKRDAVPLLEACFATSQPEVQLHALKLWSVIRAEEDRDTLAAKLRQLLASEDSSAVSRATRLAGELSPETVESELWSLLSHKSRPVRDAASQTLAKLGESRLPKANELWSARRADTRLAAVSWLKALGGPAASDELKKRLEDEEDDNVRDGILLALENISGASIEAGAAELRRRIKKTLPKLKGTPATWFDPKKLPSAELTDGSKLSSDWLLYLLYRQSRVKDMRADIEAKPLYAKLDRKTTGDLALAVVQAFFGSKADANDRWVMAFAAVIGDDRLVPVFTKQIKEWADNMRGKLAEYAVQALALLGTDSALLAVDAIAIRYRSKNKNIGKAATESFAAAAESRGLTVEELGDLVVPWLGFKPGEERIVDAGKMNVGVRINDEFKLTFREMATGKKLAKLPDSASSEVKAEFKEISASLKEAVKSQLLRMETLMVRQFRWPVDRWKELYLEHPLLLPFAHRIVWASYDASGSLVTTFRTLEDKSLTNSADEPVVLSTGQTVGIVHPLELTSDARQEWLKHLADYNIAPPFAQLERPVVIASAKQQDTKFGKEVAGTDLNAMTFKGRAERLGWTRGSVCDAGMVGYYVKSFPTAGVDVFVETEGMYVGIDMYSDITLGKIFFVKHRSVQIGSYVYDEPGDEKDPRLIPFGTVPAIAFSEAMGDLTRIAGKNKTNAETTAEN